MVVLRAPVKKFKTSIVYIIFKLIFIADQQQAWDSKYFVKYFILYLLLCKHCLFLRQLLDYGQVELA